MYQDHLGYVTIAIGNKIDPEEHAHALAGRGAPLYHKEPPGVPLTTLASDPEVGTEWQRIKNAPGLTTGGWQAAEPLAILRMRDDGITNLVANVAAEMEQYLANGHIAEFADFQSWPADAQLGLLSMSWAMGQYFADHNQWPNFRGNCGSQDWLSAARDCNMSNSWLAKRNAVNRGLFRNAAYSAAPPPSDPSELLLGVTDHRPTLRLNDSDATTDGSVSVLRNS